MSATLDADELAAMDAWWRAANYLSVGQVYLLDNPLLREPLSPAHVKPRLLGHFGTVPGLNFIQVHLDRLIRRHDASVLLVCGPGHGAPGLLASAWLDGSYTAVYPDVTRDAEGMRRLFRQFSFPGGVPSHAAPETPGSIHEGGELGYALSHAYGAVLDSPELIAACVVGDGEAETGPLATSWHSNKFLNPATDGAVLPILHLNGYKIANPTVLARIPGAELRALLEGYGYAPRFVEGDEPGPMHQAMAAAMDATLAEIRAIQARARDGDRRRPTWPMIVLRSPKGWTGPKAVDGKRTEGFWRSHQVPIEDLDKPGHLALLESWMRSYRPAELFDAAGAPVARIAALAPAAGQRMADTPQANGGQLRRDLALPDLAPFALDVPGPGQRDAQATAALGRMLAEVVRLNAATRNFRVFGPDETASNHLQALYAATGKAWDAETIADDTDLSRDGRVMEMLSEHTLQGWLEGYLLTGRHGFYSCYEAFAHIVDSMVNQHAKWLKTAREVPWRRQIASVNYLLTSHVWRQDHNGFSHQDPGFMDHVAAKKADTARIYLPPDGNTLLCVAERCLRSSGRINVIVAGKQSAPQWLTLEQAVRHCDAGIGIWDWAGTERADAAEPPDVVLACAGDVPTLETLAAAAILRERAPSLRVRVVNVVDLMALEPPGAHPHGLPDALFQALFTPDRPVVFAFHGYPSLVHRLIYKRSRPDRFHVHGYQEEGTTTTPFDMVALNGLDRFTLVADVCARVELPGAAGAMLQQAMQARLAEHRTYIRAHGDDMPAIRDWRWPQATLPSNAR